MLRNAASSSLMTLKRTLIALVRLIHISTILVHGLRSRGGAGLRLMQLEASVLAIVRSGI